MADETTDPADTTMRQVLQRHRALILPDDIDEAALLEAVKPLKVKPSAVRNGWFPVSVEAGVNRDKAIKAYTGEPNRPDTKTGEFKAPTVKAWAGGLVMVAPPKPLVVAKPLED